MHRRTDGFTLIEMMTAILVSAIILSYAIPAFMDLVQQTSTRTTTEDLVESFRNARMAAIEQKAVVVICPSSTGTSCNNSTGSWDGGYLVFKDEDNDPQVFDSTKDKVLSYQHLKDSLFVKAGSGTNYKVYFNQSGWTPGSADSLLICASQTSNKNGYHLVINRAGRIRVEDSSVTWVNGSGKSLSCSSS